jgi:NAD(P)-dependent dehydrogenase (short-subunit alcohol dehydrogenase family)
MPRTKHYPSFKAGLPSMAGKTVVITGTTSGTGRVAAATVAELGGKVLMLNRPSSRSKGARSELSAAHPSAELHAIECDLQSFASVRSAATQIRKLCPEGVHVLCNNAGVMALEDEATVDGFDVQMQTNHLSHFLLTRELWPLLERAAESSREARVVNHSSGLRMSPGKRLLGEYLERRGGSLGGNGGGVSFNGPRWIRYNQSKLANCAFTAALHHRLTERGSKVKALVAHPGLANTELQKTSVKAGGMGRRFTKLMMAVASQTPEDGAMGILSCMCLPEATSGQFYGPGLASYASKGRARPFALEGFYDNAETRELLWTKSCEAIREDFPL